MYPLLRFLKVLIKARFAPPVAPDELVVTVGSYRRLLTLPAGLARMQVRSARVDDEGLLRVGFADPALRAGEERVG